MRPPASSSTSSVRKTIRSARAPWLAAGREVERVERDGVGAGERQVGAVDGLAEALVFVFGVDDEHLHALVEQAERFEFGEVAFAGAGAGEDDAVVVVAGEAVEDDRRARVGQSVEAAAVCERRLGGGEGEGGGERLAVEGAAQAQPVEAERQRREPALERPEGGGGAAEQLRGAERLHAFACVCELVFAVGADREVDAGPVEAALAAREPGGEVLGVVGGGGDAEVAEAAALRFEPAGGFEAGALFVQPLCGELGRERLDVQRDLQLRPGAQQRGEPAVADLTRVAADRERPLPACPDAEAIGAQLERGRTEQVRRRRSAAVRVVAVCGCGSRFAWITPCRWEPCVGPGGSSVLASKWAACSPSSGVSATAAALQELDCFVGAAGECDLGEFGAPVARAQDEQDAAAVQGVAVAELAQEGGVLERRLSEPAVAACGGVLDLFGLRVECDALAADVDLDRLGEAVEEALEGGDEGGLLVRAAELEAGAARAEQTAVGAVRELRPARSRAPAALGCRAAPSSAAAARPGAGRGGLPVRAAGVWVRAGSGQG